MHIANGPANWFTDRFIVSIIATLCNCYWSFTTDCPVEGQIQRECACNITCVNRNTIANCTEDNCVHNGCQCSNDTVLDEQNNMCVAPSNCSSTEASELCYNSYRPEGIIFQISFIIPFQTSYKIPLLFFYFLLFFLFTSLLSLFFYMAPVPFTITLAIELNLYMYAQHVL